MFDADKEPALAHEMLEKRLSKLEDEAEFYSSILFDDQLAAVDSSSRVQAVLLLLRFSLVTKLVYFAQTVDPVLLQPFAQRFDDILLRTFLKVLEIENISEDQKLQIRLAVREGGCGLRSHDLKELQRLYVSSALLVAPAVFAASGERIGATDAAGMEEGRCFEHQLSSSIRDIVAYGGTRPDFSDGGPDSAKIWADSISRKFQKHTFARIEHLHRMLPLRESKRARARLKSCGGVGAQWVAALPTGPKSSFSDEEFRAIMRFRLGLPTNSLEICPHVNGDGAQCEHDCDEFGYHLLQCPSGGGFFVGHDTMCAEFADLAGGSEGIPGVVADWKAQVDAWPRSTRGYEADVGLYHLPGARDLYLDGVISPANPESYPG